MRDWHRRGCGLAVAIELLLWHDQMDDALLVQIEQLQMVTVLRSAVTRKRARSQ